MTLVRQLCFLPVAGLDPGGLHMLRSAWLLGSRRHRPDLRKLTPCQSCCGLRGPKLSSRHFRSFPQMYPGPPLPLFGSGLLTAGDSLASRTVPRGKTNSMALRRASAGLPEQAWLTCFHNNTLHFSLIFFLVNHPNGKACVLKATGEIKFLPLWNELSGSGCAHKPFHKEVVREDRRCQKEVS